MIDYNFISLQNPWWGNKDLINDDDKLREFEASPVKYFPKNILDLALKPGAINVVSGPRQTGKSTSLKLLIRKLLDEEVPAERIFYFNCDALESRKDLIDLVLCFLNGIKDTSGKVLPNYLLLDEVSSVLDWPYAIKWLVDGGFLNNSKVILTGSSSINLKKSGEFLPGRRRSGKDIRFLPIDFFEYVGLIYPAVIPDKKMDSFEKILGLVRELTIKKINLQQTYRNFILTGGFMRLINSSVRGEPYSNPVEIYISGLKSELAKTGKKELAARRVLDKVVSGLTAETSYTNVAEEAELGSKNTAADYLGFFRDSYLLTETMFYSIPQKRAVVKKNKKYYPTDPFLFWVFNSFITGSNDIELFFQKYSTPPLDSQIAESFIASELYKNGFEFYFFKDSKELDFFIPKEEVGIEVKYKNKIVSSDLEGLRYCKRKILISKNTLESRSDILIIPAYLFGFMDLTKI